MSAKLCQSDNNHARRRRRLVQPAMRERIILDGVNDINQYYIHLVL